MFPALPPGGIDSGPVRRPEPEGPGPTVGVQPVRMDPEGARQPAPAVAGAEASNTRVRPEALAVQERQAREADARQPPFTAGPQAVTVSPRLQWLMQGLQALLGAAAPASGTAASAAALGGAADTLPWPTAGQPAGDTPLQALARLHAALGQSPWFAMNPRTTAELGAGVRQFAAWQAAPGAAPAADTAAPAESMVGAAGSPADPAPDAATATAATAATAAAAMADALAASATPRQTVEALQLLLHGRLQWEGELTPGVQAGLRRETVWEEDPDHPGQLQSGSLLRLDLALPSIGPLVVLARLVGGRCAVQLLPAAQAAPALDAALGELQTALAPLTDTPVALSLQAPP
jgi:hypothetical protein